MFVTQIFRPLNHVSGRFKGGALRRLCLLLPALVLGLALIVGAGPVVWAGDDRSFMKEGGLSKSELPDLLDDPVVAPEERPLVEAPKALPKERAEKVRPVPSLRLALSAYQQKRFKDAISGFEAAAENNSFIARFLLAHIYRTGKGSAVDHRRAYDYYRQITVEFADADIQNTRHAPYVAHAFVQLARYMEAGVKELDIGADPTAARILFEKAAHFGDVEGQYQLGRFLIESGRGRNVKLGQRWLTRAAMKNNPKAQAYLGALYWQGDVVARKQALALAWIEFARRNATGSVKARVERLYEAVRYDMSKAQTKKAQLYIKRLRTQYRVLWREEPARAEEQEREFLDGIFLTEPPQGPNRDEFAEKGLSFQYRDAPPAGQDAESYAPPSFGFQLFNYGDALGQ